jgi:hypothetical protein
VADNAADPAFADEYPNGTHWKNVYDKYCFAAFDRWDDERRVFVNRGGIDGTSPGGLPACPSSSQSSEP